MCYSYRPGLVTILLQRFSKNYQKGLKGSNQLLFGIFGVKNSPEKSFGTIDQGIRNFGEASHDAYYKVQWFRSLWWQATVYNIDSSFYLSKELV